MRRAAVPAPGSCLGEGRGVGASYWSWLEVDDAGVQVDAEGRGTVAGSGDLEALPLALVHEVLVAGLEEREDLVQHDRSLWRRVDGGVPDGGTCLADHRPPGTGLADPDRFPGRWRQAGR